MLILSFHDTGAQFCAKVKSLRNNLALLRKFLFLLQYGTVFFAQYPAFATLQAGSNVAFNAVTGLYIQ